MDDICTHAHSLQKYSDEMLSTLASVDFVRHESERFADGESWEALVRAEYHEGYHRCPHIRVSIHVGLSQVPAHTSVHTCRAITGARTYECPYM